jgi:hypothetical protein
MAVRIVRVTRQLTTMIRKPRQCRKVVLVKTLIGVLVSLAHSILIGTYENQITQTRGNVELRRKEGHASLDRFSSGASGSGA